MLVARQLVTGANLSLEKMEQILREEMTEKHNEAQRDVSDTEDESQSEYPTSAS